MTYRTSRSPSTASPSPVAWSSRRPVTSTPTSSRTITKPRWSISSTRSGPVSPSPEGATPRRERGRSDGRPSQEHRWRRRGTARGGKEAGQEIEEGDARPKGNADADCRQKAGEGGGGEEAIGQAAAEVGLVA